MQTKEKDIVCDIAKSFRLSNNVAAQIMSSQDCSWFNLPSGARGEQYPPPDNLAPCLVPSSMWSLHQQINWDIQQETLPWWVK